ncbi:24125_t:CDS:1, partial [Racocetra persica]
EKNVKQKAKMGTELNHIPEKDYKKIKENPSRLNIPTFSDEFLTNHDHRRNLKINSPERLKIKNENRIFLEKYWKVDELITFWYGKYLYKGIGGNKDEKTAKL